ncbi:MAG: hypothetical protein ACRCTZ_20260, partial [Sarcina sp.]
MKTILVSEINEKNEEEIFNMLSEKEQNIMLNMSSKRTNKYKKQFSDNYKEGSKISGLDYFMTPSEYFKDYVNYMFEYIKDKKLDLKVMTKDEKHFYEFYTN